MPLPKPLTPTHGELPPSSWVLRWTPLLPEGARVLDLACGGGRHLRALAGRGLQLTGVDRDAQALAGLAGLDVETVQADLEAGPWPLPGRRFDAILVTNYLWRPLWPALLDALAPGGLWLHETFALGQEAYGRPRQPAFLLAPGELLEVARAAGLRVLAYEDGLLDAPTRRVQRIVAVREDGSPAGPGPWLAPPAGA